MSRNKYYIELINSKEWRTIRNKVIKVRPLCEDCKSVGVYTSATEVHHIIPVESVRDKSEMKRLAYDISNLASLCHEHHVLRHRELRMDRKEISRRTREVEMERFKDRFNL